MLNVIVLNSKIENLLKKQLKLDFWPINFIFVRNAYNTKHKKLLFLKFFFDDLRRIIL